METRHAILATAGHIDHGKSALVKALTGNDPDRLPEEKQRGITIDLGFAHLELAGYSLGIVDVPGHQDFVKNMVAGVGAVDLALLVVAADDGWMPQTEEHLQILSYLGASQGVVALTKSDLIDDPTERIREIRHQLSESPLANAAIIPASSHTGAGLDELKNALSATANQMIPHEDHNQPRLAVDRVFSLQGIGTVVTGTLTGGIMSKKQTVTSQPSGRESRIRSLQSHNHECDTAQPGTRTALNLASTSRETIVRGSTITLPNLATTTKILDVQLTRSPRLPKEAAPLRNNTRVRVHHGSGHWAARLVLVEGKILEPGQTQFAQLRLEQPVCVWSGDRIVIRNWPESATLAGGRVLDAQGDRKTLRTNHQKLFLKTRAESPLEAGAWITSRLARDGLTKCEELLRPSHFSPYQIEEAVAILVKTGTALAIGNWLIDQARWNTLRNACATRVDDEHTQHPELHGLALEQLRPILEKAFPGHDIFNELIDELCKNGFIRLQSHIARADHKPALPPHLRQAGEQVRHTLQTTDPPARKTFTQSPTSRAALQFLIDTGEVIDVNPEVVLSTAQFNRFKLIVRQHLRKNGEATASDLRKALETTRRILIPLLEKLDRDGVTARRGDVRVLRKVD